MSTVLAATLSLLALLQQPPGMTLEVKHRPPPVEQPDCNGNGVPDPVEIRLGLAADCPGDGIPDDCQLADPFPYAYDDGAMDGSVGTVPRYVAWLTHHTVVPGLETIRGIELAWGLMPSGTPATLGLWSDPDGDGNPIDAQLLVSHVAFAQFPQTGVVVSEDIPDTYVPSRNIIFLSAALALAVADAWAAFRRPSELAVAP